MVAINVMNPTRTQTVGHNANARSTNHDNRIDLSANAEPWFSFVSDPGSTRILHIAPRYSLNGDSFRRFTFRINASDWTNRRSWVYQDALDGTIDLDATGLGGRVSGLALAATTHYHLWAFASGTKNPVFKGFGASKQPVSIITSVASGGTLGSSAVLNVTATEGLHFTVGARVICRAGTALGDNYNQGVITARAANTVTVTLDATYGAINETNTTIVGMVNGELMQTDSFTPFVAATGAVFGGYHYTYMGSLFVDSSSNIVMMPRKRGDLRFTTAQYIVYNQSGTAAPAATTQCLARWIPFGRKVNAYLGAIISGTGSTRRMIVQHASTFALGPLDTGTSSTLAASDEAPREFNGVMPIRMRDCSIYCVPSRAGASGTATWQVVLQGYTTEDM